MTSVIKALSCSSIYLYFFILFQSSEGFYMRIAKTESLKQIPRWYSKRNKVRI